MSSKKVQVVAFVSVALAGAAVGYYVGNRADGSGADGVSKSVAGERSFKGWDDVVAALDPVSEEAVRPSQLLRLEGLTAAEAAEAFDRLRDLPRTREARELRTALLQKWGELDPPAAIAAAKSLTGRDRLNYLAEAIAGWARSDPDAAWDYWMRESRDGAVSNMNPASIVRVLAAANLEDAVRRGLQLKGEQSRFGALNALMRNAEDQGKFAQTLSALSMVEDDSERSRATESLFRSWSSFDSDEALVAIQSIGDEAERNVAMKGFIQGWAAADGVSALDYVVDHFDDPTAADAAKSIGRNLVRSMTGDELILAIGSIENPEAQEAVVSGILKELAVVDPLVAMSFVDGIPKEKKRAEETRVVLQQWLEADEKAATEYFANLEGDLVKAKALSAFADRKILEGDISKADGSRYLNLLGSIEDEKLRRQSLSVYAGAAGKFAARGQTELADQMVVELLKSDLLDDAAKDKVVKRIYGRD